MSDPYFSNVELLIHGNGTDGSTSIIDSSSSPKTITAGGEAQILTAVSKFGGSSIHFSGFGGHYLTFSRTGFDFLTDTTQDFTFECWCYLTSASYSTHYTIFQIGDNAPNLPSFTIKVDPTTGTVSASITRTDINGGFGAGTTSVMPFNTWTYVAVSFVASTGVIRIFLDGNQEGSSTKPVGASFSTPAYNPVIGAFAYAYPLSWLGYLDEIRITKGVARYTSSFTPPTEEFPDTFGHSISGSTTVSITPLATMVQISNFSFNGSTSITVTPSSELLKTPLHYDITGALTGEIVPISTLDYVSHHHDLFGFSGISVTSLSSLLYFHDTGADINVTLEGFDGEINRMEANATLEGFNGDIQAEGGWANVIECTLDGFDGDIVVLGGAEIILEGFDGDIVSIWTTPEYAYVTLDGFNGDIVATMSHPTLINVTLQGFNGDIEAYGGAIAILDGFDGDIVATAIVPETINILLDGFNGDITATIYVPTFINAILDGFDGDLWECRVTLDGFNGDIEAVSVTSVANSQAFVMNTNTSAVARWTNYPFDNVVRLGDDYYGVNANGFYKLEGDLDLTTPISGKIVTKDSDQGKYQSKTIQYVYINGDTKVKVTPIVDGVTKTWQYSTFSGRKAKLGLGNSGRYWQFEISDIKKLQGIETIEFDKQRRVH